MEYIKATEKHTEQIYKLVQNTMKAVYPKYYPKEVVDFFCKLHSTDNISEDIKNGCVFLLFEDNCLVGTGSHKKDHITRVFVDTAFQGQGYGSYIMQNLENEITLKYDRACLDASLPASHFYEKRGYTTVKHEKCGVENGAVLVYEIMQKQLPAVTSSICYR